MKVNIYGIINPITKEIVYIGQTPSNLDYYIKTKFGIYYKNELVCKCNYAFEVNEFFNKQI